MIIFIPCDTILFVFSGALCLVKSTSHTYSINIQMKIIISHRCNRSILLYTNKTCFNTDFPSLDSLDVFAYSEQQHIEPVSWNLAYTQKSSYFKHHNSPLLFTARC